MAYVACSIHLLADTALNWVLMVSAISPFCQFCWPLIGHCYCGWWLIIWSITDIQTKKTNGCTSVMKPCGHCYPNRECCGNSNYSVIARTICLYSLEQLGIADSNPLEPSQLEYTDLTVIELSQSAVVKDRLGGVRIYLHALCTWGLIYSWNIIWVDMFYQYISVYDRGIRSLWNGLEH